MTEPLPSGDERRDDVVILRAGPNLQREIDSLPSKVPAVKVLRIEDSFSFDAGLKHTLAISLPQLETLKLINVDFEKIVLNTRLTPKIKELYMERISNDCFLTIVLPELTSFAMHHYIPACLSNHPNPGWINTMLKNAKRLQKFDSFGFCVDQPLYFASNHLEWIRLQNVRYLRGLILYAPRMKYLSLSYCLTAQDAELKILDSHPDFVSPVRWTIFEVNTVGANLSPEIRWVLKYTPRVFWDGISRGNWDGEEDLVRRFGE